MIDHGMVNMPINRFLLSQGGAMRNKKNSLHIGFELPLEFLALAMFWCALSYYSIIYFHLESFLTPKQSMLVLGVPTTLTSFFLVVGERYVKKEWPSMFRKMRGGVSIMYVLFVSLVVVFIFFRK